MKTDKKQEATTIPAFLSKVMQDKKDIKQALKNKKSLNDLAKEKGINFAKPYKVKLDADGLTYTFTTRFDIKYTLALTTYFLGEVKAFSLSLYPETEPTNFDYWIKKTVVKIIGDILLNDANVIFYIFDNEDERELIRYKVFEYWYQQAVKDYPYVHKYNHQLYSPNGYNLYSAILYNADNFLESYIIAEFKKALEIS